MDVIISSLNPAKISAVEAAFNQAFPDSVFNFIGVSVDSGVPDQPMSCIDTKQGAINRVNNAKIQHPNAEYYVGLEAGIEGNSTFAWMIIDNTKQVGESRSSSLPLPPAVITAVNQGKELGDVMDEQFNTDNIKQKGGAIGLLTNNLLTRSSVYQQALILALIPFLHPERFFEVTS
ncbi:non-canonical purine NTP phosphatase [Aliivibrio finisterrensis]|uniref:Inosine/xanthosine triphosphatase n=1 Tax=Aliivibrio finisterrensis TaxID=511998 RepID=A0A4Q5KM74_9GAMM|nr:MULTISPECIES: inosine/xanthosine triphosphatase [Aliivibrio]MDD9177013.1 inosine/xanthosine triphosphatase [Aliivibrio sp. S3TY1]MDD9194075.1 inosine/xanthosine triphosphatase [Aliivibrio sp. S2TY2]RYU46756.1 non-canonical purine NTP phosphatase [Aliivibrio finisterrensis]